MAMGTQSKKKSSVVRRRDVKGMRRREAVTALFNYFVSIEKVGKGGRGGTKDRVQ
jgi:hypothetical protein